MLALPGSWALRCGGTVRSQAPGSNALDVSDGVKARMATLQKRFPEGLDYAIHYDTTPFVRY